MTRDPLLKQPGVPLIDAVLSLNSIVQESSGLLGLQRLTTKQEPSFQVKEEVSNEKEKNVCE